MKKKSLEKLELARARRNSNKPTRINILALDQATHCGVAYETRVMRGKYQCELWDLTKKTKESDGVKWLRFESHIEKLIKEHDIEIIAYELPAGQHMGAKIHSAKLIAIIERIAELNKIQYIEHSSMTIKKFATGKGNAKKEQMIEAAKNKLNYQGDDDNEADALWMLMYTKSQLN